MLISSKSLQDTSPVSLQNHSNKNNFPTMYIIPVVCSTFYSKSNYLQIFQDVLPADRPHTSIRDLTAELETFALEIWMLVWLSHKWSTNLSALSIILWKQWGLPQQLCIREQSKLMKHEQKNKKVKFWESVEEVRLMLYSLCLPCVSIGCHLPPQLGFKPS